MTSLSIIMPVFNHGHFLARAVEAICQQSWRPHEMFLIDDGSTDDTATIIREISQRHSFIKPVFIQKNGGAAEAIKRVWNEVCGEYVYFAAADDRVYGDFFSASIAVLEKHPQLSFCTALTDDIAGTIPPLATPLSKIISPEKAAQMIRRHGTWFRCNTAVYRRKSLVDLGGFDPALGPFGDGFACMHLAITTGCAFIPNVFCLVNIDHNSTSRIFDEKPGAIIDVFKVAEKKMSSELCSDFPDDLVSAWGRQWRLTVAKKLLSSSSDDTWRQIHQALVPPLIQIDVSMLRALSGVTMKVASALLLFRLLPRQFLCRLLSR